ncbi:MAG: hypothetical protein ACRDPH_05640 [Marmoricola sp.]
MRTEPGLAAFVPLRVGFLLPELTELLQPDDAAAERHISDIANQGINVDALGEARQRQGAHAFEADWASLLEAIHDKTTHT